VTRARYRALSGAEVERVRGACRTPRERLVVESILQLGMRLREVAGVRRVVVQPSEPVTIRLEGADRTVWTVRTPDLMRLWAQCTVWREPPYWSVRTLQRTIAGVAQRAGLEHRVTARALRRHWALYGRFLGQA